ncbi:MAG: nucleotidyl transferase AbiEii/AbiGii toxin family protein [Spirochaetia bacterium]|nr:nucleotidyl transferase AbiEii/AbiGii toxin family protein [Spirochaetia bacterium]
MSIRVIEQKLRSYSVSSEIEEMQALREITQEIILASLGKTDFFTMAAFQGGTCLRIFHGLNRFSEDLDFTLLSPNPEFAWQGYLEQVTNDVAAFGHEMEVKDRNETKSPVKLAFHKDEAVVKILQLHYAGKTRMLGKIRIKLEIDTNPPPGGLNEMKYMDFPYLSPVTVQNLATLFASKIHALLCRNYVKGRDWYDFIWYTARKTPVNYQYLEEALRQSGPWKDTQDNVDRSWLHDALYKRIKNIDWAEAGMDVRRFIPVNEQHSIDFWNAVVFIQQLDKL